jgi:hypothetical protein
MQEVGSGTALLDRFDLVVDPDADLLDLDRLLDALDRLVERRLSARKAAADSNSTAEPAG